MIYQQQTVVADSPAMMETMAADALGLSSSCFCAAVEAAAEMATGAVTADAPGLSSSSCFCAVVETATGADAVADSANSK